MQIQCMQVVLTPIIDEEIFNKDEQLNICKSLLNNRTIFSGAIKRNLSTTKYDQLRIRSISEDNLLDIVSIGANHTLTLKDIPLDSIVHISIMSNSTVDSEEAKNLTIYDFLDI